MTGIRLLKQETGPKGNHVTGAKPTWTPASRRGGNLARRTGDTLRWKDTLGEGALKHTPEISCWRCNSTLQKYNSRQITPIKAVEASSSTSQTEAATLITKKKQ